MVQYQNPNIVHSYRTHDTTHYTNTITWQGFVRRSTTTTCLVLLLHLLIKLPSYMATTLPRDQTRSSHVWSSHLLKRFKRLLGEESPAQVLIRKSSCRKFPWRSKWLYAKKIAKKIAWTESTLLSSRSIKTIYNL